MEAIGDITASAEVSRLKVTGDDFDSRIQGGILVNTSYTCVLFTILLILRVTALEDLFLHSLPSRHCPFLHRQVLCHDSTI
jgi:hypothetical protein